MADFFTDYRLAYSFSFEHDGAPKKRIIGQSTPRRCRFCGRGVPEVTFKSDAHVIPAAFGNRDLFSYEECDSCNNDGSKLENQLCDALTLTRAVSRIRSRKGPLTYRRRPAGLSTIQTVPEQNLLRLELVAGDTTVGLEETIEGGLRLEVEIPPTNFVDLCKALCRMALFVLPLPVVNGDCTHLLDWIAGRVDYLPCFYRVFLPGTGRKLVRLKVYERSGATGAPWMVQFDYSSVTLLLPLPGADLTVPVHQTLPMIGLSPFPPHVPKAERIECLTNEKMPARKEFLSLGYAKKTPMVVPAATEGNFDLTLLDFSSLQATQSSAVVPQANLNLVMQGGSGLRVKVHILNEQGDVLWTAAATLEITERCLRMTAPASTLEVDFASSVVNFEVSDLTTVSLDDAISAIEMQLALATAATLEAAETDGQQVLWSAINHAEFDTEQSKLQLEVATRLKLVNAACKLDLRLPRTLSAEDKRTLEFASTAIEVGRFAERPLEEYLVPVGPDALPFLRAAELVPVENLQSAMNASIYLLGVALDLGPWLIQLERPVLAVPLAEVENHFLGSAAPIMVPFTASRAFYVFPNLYHAESEPPDGLAAPAE